MRRIVLSALVVGLLSAGLLRAADNADPMAVIDKAIQATGGTAKLAKYHGNLVKMKGQFHGMGTPIDFTGEMTTQTPNKMRFALDMEVMGSKFTFLQIFNGKEGWISLNGTVTEMDKDAAEEARESLHSGSVEHLLPLKSKDYTLSTLGEDKVGDRPVVGVRASRKGYRDVNLYFDKEKFLLLKSATVVKDPMAGGQEQQGERFFSDYKEQDGIRYAGKVKIKRDGKDYVDSETLEYKPQEKVDDSVFAKP